MRSHVAVLTVLVLALSASGCSQGDDEGSGVEATENTLATTSTSSMVPPESSGSGIPTTTGGDVSGADPELLESGVLEADFQPSRGPIDAALSALGEWGDGAKRVEVVATNSDIESVEQSSISVIVSGLGDDSVRSLHFAFSVERDDGGSWTVSSATWGQVCAEGRGQQEALPDPCL